MVRSRGIRQKIIINCCKSSQICFTTAAPTGRLGDFLNNAFSSVQTFVFEYGASDFTYQHLIGT